MFSRGIFLQIASASFNVGSNLNCSTFTQIEPLRRHLQEKGNCVGNNFHVNEITCSYQGFFPRDINCVFCFAGSTENIDYRLHTAHCANIATICV